MKYTKWDLHIPAKVADIKTFLVPVAGSQIYIFNLGKLGLTIEDCPLAPLITLDPDQEIQLPDHLAGSFDPILSFTSESLDMTLINALFAKTGWRLRYKIKNQWLTINGEFGPHGSLIKDIVQTNPYDDWD